MGFVEGILCKVHHILVNLSCHFLGNTVCHTPGHALLGIAVHKVGTFLFHNRLFFLTHGTAHQVTPSQSITSQVTHNLHHLLLVHDTTVGRLQNRLQLRAGIGNRIFVVFAFNIFRDKIHRARTIQGNTCDDILQTLWAKLLHEALHTRTFQLEHTVSLTGANGSQHLFIIIINLIYIYIDAPALLNKLHCIIYNRQSTKA